MQFRVSFLFPKLNEMLINYGEFCKCIIVVQLPVNDPHFSQVDDDDEGDDVLVR